MRKWQKEKLRFFPDYKGVTIPVNIAPLNFKLKEPFKAILLLSGKGRQIRVNTDRGSFQTPKTKWSRLLEASAGDTITAGIYIYKDNSWYQYKSFPIRIAKEKIDPYLVYRRIAPGYRM
ncbi:MAG: hypothetical protein LUH63_03510 [Parabacteroides sp.]|nr:hypothetical protein [Parabacteroides sp.]